MNNFRLSVLAIFLATAIASPTSKAFAQFGDCDSGAGSNCPGSSSSTSSGSSSGSTSGSTSSGTSSSGTSSGLPVVGGGYFPRTDSDVRSSDKPRTPGDYIKEQLTPNIRQEGKLKLGNEAAAYFNQYYKNPGASIDMAEKSHPWNDGNPESEPMWLSDTARMLRLDDPEMFRQCMEPRLVKGICEHCQPKGPPFFLDKACKIPLVNIGQIVEYWWPTYEVEVNNFGISALNPVNHHVAKYARDALQDELRREKNSYWGMQKDYLETTFGFSVPAANPLETHTPVGGHHTEGHTAGNQYTSGEGHVYQTELNARVTKHQRCNVEPPPGRNQACGRGDFLYISIPTPIGSVCIPLSFYFNGFKKGNPAGCFYDTLEPQGRTPKAWTESKYFRPFWLYQACSSHMDRQGGMYENSVPKLADIQDMSGTWVKTKSCTAYRAKRSGQKRMQELEKIMWDAEELEQTANNCYSAYGQVYPLAGIEDTQSSMTGFALLARRAMELAGQRADCNLTHSPDIKCTGITGEHVNRFTRLTNILGTRKEVDKVQVISPAMFDKSGRWKDTPAGPHDYTYPSTCMDMNEANELLHEISPADLARPDHKGSVRFVIWEKRQACFCPYRSNVSDLEKQYVADSYTHPIICAAMEGGCSDYGWGCMIYPKYGSDYGRGNVAASDILGENSTCGTALQCITTPMACEGSADHVPMCCYYPYTGGSKCVFPNNNGQVMSPSSDIKCDFPKCEPLPTKPLCE